MKTTARRSRSWSEVDAEIIAALDIRAEYEQLGVEITGAEPNAKGWLQCRAFDRKDRNPSAAINLHTGRYRDLGGEGLSLSLWDFATKRNGVADWREARKTFAEKAGVQLPNGRPPRRPDDNLRFLDWSAPVVSKWCRIKPPITPEAIMAVGGRLAKYRNQYLVIALPVFGPALLDADPSGYVLFEINGRELPIFHKGKRATSAKMKTTAGSKAGVIGNLRTFGKQTQLVFKLEGPSDVLALLSAIPSDHVNKFLAVTNSGGAEEHPRPDIVSLFEGRRVVVIGDADQPGQRGAERWAREVTLVAQRVRNVRMPYKVETNHGKDLRDYLTDGHTFDDLHALARSTPVLTPETVRPQIIISTDESRVIDEAIEALSAEPNIFRRAGMLVQVIRDGDAPSGIDRPPDAPRIAPLRSARLRELMASSADWLHPSSENELRPSHPPDWAVAGVGARGEWPSIRRLEGVVESPVLRADGSVLQTPGYDMSTGLLYEPQAKFPEISGKATEADAEEARDSLLEVVEDFPFFSDNHRAAWVASTLTPLARWAFRGPSPLFLIDANIRGAGKSLLVDVTGQIVAGHELARMTAPTDDQEFRKKITALALLGEPLVLIDNVVGTLGSPSLDAALTGTTWTDRALGRNEMITLPLTAVWFATANNIVLGADTVRRVLHIRLESLEENPEQRSGFHHPDLLRWVRSERPRLTTAAITILSGFCAAGRPDMELKPWGSFEGWSDLVRQAVVWSGLPDPVETRTELQSDADREVNALRNLIAGWEILDPDGCGLTVSDVLRGLEDFRKGQKTISASTIEGYDLIDNALADLIDTKDSRPPTPQSLGMKLHHLRHRVVGGKYFDRDDQRKKSGTLWKVAGCN